MNHTAQCSRRLGSTPASGVAGRAPLPAFSRATFADHLRTSRCARSFPRGRGKRHAGRVRSPLQLRCCPERAQPCSRGPKSPNWRTKLSALLLLLTITVTLLMLSPTSAHAQGGVPLWTNRYDGPASLGDGPNAIAVDKNGNVFVTGISWNAEGQPYDADYATVAYSNSGEALGPAATMSRMISR